MRGHILNCATIELYFPRISVATCCLLIEWGDGLLLVDTGIGEEDHLHPSKGLRLMPTAARTFGKPEETALKQVTDLGYSSSDVKHIVMTHLHIDHAGGLRDFLMRKFTSINPNLKMRRRKAFCAAQPTSLSIGHINQGGSSTKKKTSTIGLVLKLSRF